VFIHFSAQLRSSIVHLGAEFRANVKLKSVALPTFFSGGGLATTATPRRSVPPRLQCGRAQPYDSSLRMNGFMMLLTAVQEAFSREARSFPAGVELSGCVDGAVHVLVVRKLLVTVRRFALYT
jgi:hypothetical protein